TVEKWIPFARQTTAREDVAVLEEAIVRLRAMTDAVARGESPGDGGEQVARLRTLIERLEAAPPPPLGETIPVSPEPARPPMAADKRALQDDLDQQLLPVFLEEAQELVPAIGADLRDWKANPANDNVSQSLRRGLHTLKGSARMAGAIRLGELTHLMESLIEEAIEANSYPPELFRNLEDKMDRLSADVERLHAGPEAEPEPAKVETVEGKPGAQEPKERPKPVAPPVQQLAAMLRVNADTLDHLI